MVVLLPDGVGFGTDLHVFSAVPLSNGGSLFTGFQTDRVDLMPKLSMHFFHR